MTPDEYAELLELERKIDGLRARFENLARRVAQALEGDGVSIVSVAFQQDTVVYYAEGSGQSGYGGGSEWSGRFPVSFLFDPQKAQKR